MQLYSYDLNCRVGPDYNHEGDVADACTMHRKAGGAFGPAHVDWGFIKPDSKKMKMFTVVYLLAALDCAFRSAENAVIAGATSTRPSISCMTSAECCNGLQTRQIHSRHILQRQTCLEHVGRKTIIPVVAVECLLQGGVSAKCLLQGGAWPLCLLATLEQCFAEHKKSQCCVLVKHHLWMIDVLSSSTCSSH